VFDGFPVLPDGLLKTRLHNGAENHDFDEAME
jgi:hypothetical protein